MDLLLSSTKRQIHPVREALLVGAAVFAVAISVLGYTYSYAHRAQIDAVRTELVQLAKALAVQVDGDLHEQLVRPEQSGSPEHLRALEPLLQLQRAAKDLIYVYSASLLNGQVTFVLDTAYLTRPADDTDPPPLIGFVYSERDPTVRRALTERTALASPELIPEKVRTYLSAYAPLHNSRGEFVGVVGIDMWARDLEMRLSDLRNMAIAATCGIAMLSLLIGVLTYRLRRSAAAAERRAIDSGNKLREEKTRTDHLNERLQQAIRNAEEEARSADAANHAKSAFLAVMSHEIRTPMNGVLGMAQLLGSTNLTTEQQEYIRTIRGCGETLLTIINDVLDYSKIEAGRVEIEHTPVDLRTLVETVVDVCGYQAREKHIELSFLFAHDVPSLVYGDTTRIQQILFNLLGNAIKFTSSGEVFLNIECGDRQGANCIHFSVRDTGIGIPPERMDRLFKAFSQVDSAATTRRYGGTGLGLAIAHRLTELMKGHMWVESELGQGSTFHFTIPAEVPDDALPPPHSAVESALAGRRAVILSEQPTVRHVLSTMCRWWGIAPYEADQPAAALALLRSATPCDVFILDRQLGSRDGTTLIETVRSIPGRDALPLFLLDSNQSLTPIDGITVLSKPLKATHLRIMLLQTFGACPDDNLVFTASQAPEFDNTFGRRMPLRILIADDDAVNQRSLALMLERLGYAATVVSGGTAAYEMARRSSFDLVFMDIGMPGLDGREVTRHIRRNSDHPAVPWIVAFTAMAGPGARNALLAAGMNDCLFKPFRADELTEVLARGYRALQQLRGVMAN